MPSKAHRFALWLFYQGTAFGGFQTQKRGTSVQEKIESALHRLGVQGHPVPAGRTDRGVSARMQVVRISAPQCSAESLAAAVDAALSPHGGVHACRPVSPDFHPQWSALSKEYRYRLREKGTGHFARDEQLVPALHLQSSLSPFPVWDLQAEPRLSGRRFSPHRMEQALRAVQGVWNFSAFHLKTSAVKPRNLMRAELHPQGPGAWDVHLVGDGFARHQVRFLVGAAALVACEVLWLEALEAAVKKGTPIPGLRAPPQPLTLWDVRYPPDLDPFASDRHLKSSD